MKTLAHIRRQLAEGRFEFSRHAFRRAVERNISDPEIREAGAQAEVIEEYPDDKYSPSSLLLGFTAAGRPLHLQVSYAETEMTKIAAYDSGVSSARLSPSTSPTQRSG